jgi:hypothetical protein
MGSKKRLFIRILCIVAVLSFAFSQIDTQTTTLTIYSNVCGFEVWWDGKHIFTTPPDKDWCWFYCVSTGKHTITLKKSGCADATVVVNIVSGQNEISVNMVCGGGGGSDETKDSDGDGVTDDKDRCGNPDCIIVDSQGCPKDSDSDGINDCDDKCPYEKGVASNDGCQPASSDKDSDGVNDDRDSCYNPGCSIVDSQGCPKDSDSDGINDCDDRCRSHSGPSSNNGCPEEPSDRDSDGVTDDRDSCYNPGCSIVDSQGCPRDSDSDGINDCDDDCRYEEGPGSNNGCPEDYSKNILKYWWVIAVLIVALGALSFLSQRRSPQN